MCAKIMYVQILTVTSVIKLAFHARSLIHQNDGYLKRQQQMEDDQKTSPSSYPEKKRNIPALQRLIRDGLKFQSYINGETDSNKQYL